MLQTNFCTILEPKTAIQSGTEATNKLTNFMELNPFLEAASHAATQEFPKIL
jgi:hypothetical protein